MKKLFVKIVSLLTILFVVGCCGSIMYANKPEVKNVELLKSETIALVKNVDGIQTVFCSGIWVDKEHIITARHCVSNFIEEGIVSNIEVNVNYITLERGKVIQVDSAKTRTAHVIDVDQYQDLALIKTDAKNSPKYHGIARIARGKINDGTQVDIIGHTVGWPWTYLKGYISATRTTAYTPEGFATKALQVSSPVFKGNSGGGAFNSEGELVGLCSWVDLAAPNMSFFIHRDEIVSFLRRNKIHF